MGDVLGQWKKKTETAMMGDIGLGVEGLGVSKRTISLT